MKVATAPQAKKIPQAKKVNIASGVPQGAKPLVMTLWEKLTPTIFYMLIIMGISMLNLLVLKMFLLLVLFRFPRPLLLTKEDPLQNGYLNQSNNLL